MNVWTCIKEGDYLRNLHRDVSRAGHSQQYFYVAVERGIERRGSVTKEIKIMPFETTWRENRRQNDKGRRR